MAHAPDVSDPLAQAREGVSRSGFEFRGQEGSHRVYVKPGVPRPVVIPASDEVPVMIIKNNLNTAGISREEYFRLLELA